MRVLFEMYYSLLPRRQRERLSVRGDLFLGSLLTGAMQFLLFALLLVLGYAHFMALRAQQMPWLAKTNVGTQFYMTVILTIEYLFFHPVYFLLFYFTLEGGVRLFGVLSTRANVPSLPFEIAERLRSRSQRKRYEAGLGPEVEDAVEYLDGEPCLRIASHEPKEGWRVSITVSCGGELYQIAKEDRGPVPRSFIYYLRKHPAGEVVRGVYHYDLKTKSAVLNRNVAKH